MKMDLLDDVFKIVVPEDWTEETLKSGTNWCTATKVGDFTVLYDESQDTNKKAAIKKNNTKIWK